MICQQNVAVPRPWSISKMRHPGRLNGWGLIGSPYLALEPISASWMMYTSLNSCRQLQLSPFIQTSRKPPRALPSYARTSARTVHVNGKGRTHSPHCLHVSAWFCHLSSTNKGVPGQTLVCKHACAIVCVQSCVPSRSSSFAFNKHRAGGQRALLYIRSASSNSKRHQRPPAAILCVTMRWRAQWKLVMNVGSESRLSSARLGCALPLKAIHCSQPWQ